MQPMGRNQGPRPKPVPVVTGENVVNLSDARGRRDVPKPAVLNVTTAVDLDAEVDALAHELGAMRSRLEFMRGAVEVGSLAGSLLGLVGNSAEDIRIQLRPLREALKDQGGAS